MEWFLTHPAVNRNVAASTQNQAKSALLFLYKEAVALELPWLDDVSATIYTLVLNKGGKAVGSFAGYVINGRSRLPRLVSDWRNESG